MDGGEGDGGGSQATAVDPVAQVVFALLVLACLAAFFLTQRLKHTPTAVQRFQLTPSFAPGRRGPEEQEHISFKIAHADAVTVAIVNSRGDAVATLVRNHRLPRYKQFSLRWNGRTGTARRFRALTSPDGHVFVLPLNPGRPAPAGEYRVRVTLREQGRTVFSPRSFTLVRT